MPEEELEDEDEELAELAVASESLSESLEEDLLGGMLDKKLAHAHRLPVPDGTFLIFFFWGSNYIT